MNTPRTRRKAAQQLETKLATLKRDNDATGLALGLTGLESKPHCEYVLDLKRELDTATARAEELRLHALELRHHNAKLTARAECGEKIIATLETELETVKQSRATLAATEQRIRVEANALRSQVQGLKAKNVMRALKNICETCGHTTTEDGCAFCIGQRAEKAENLFCDCQCQLESAQMEAKHWQEKVLSAAASARFSIGHNP